ncbi:hypothetical protein [Jiangella muralis]|uniref:hypothetical protein n=1 Tax=Jiangella muralis TaxID=702383 RepID=UPI0012F88E23|nr:hypothetical protein [Jiangella muralis]
MASNHTVDRITSALELADSAQWERAFAQLNLARAAADDTLGGVAVDLARAQVMNEQDWTMCLHDPGRKHDLLEAVDRALTTEPDDRLRAHYLYERGMALHIDFCMGTPDQSAELAAFEESAERYHVLGDQEGEASALAFIGIFHHVDRLDPDTAWPILMHAYEISPQGVGSVGRYEAARHLGQILHEAGKAEEGLTWLLDALEVRAQSGCARGLAPALHAVGAARMGMGDLEGAGRDLERARAIAVRYGSRYFLAFIERTQADLRFRQVLGPHRRGTYKP